MDKLKLAHWKESFDKEVKHLQTEYDAFFQAESITDCYRLNMDETKQNLILELTSEEKLPKEIKSQMLRIFEQTKPEDSI